MRDWTNSFYWPLAYEVVKVCFAVKLSRRSVWIIFERLSWLHFAMQGVSSRGFTVVTLPFVAFGLYCTSWPFTAFLAHWIKLRLKNLMCECYTYKNATLRSKQLSGKHSMKMRAISMILLLLVVTLCSLHLLLLTQSWTTFFLNGAEPEGAVHGVSSMHGRYCREGWCRECRTIFTYVIYTKSLLFIIPLLANKHSQLPVPRLVTIDCMMFYTCLLSIRWTWSVFQSTVCT